MNLDQICRDTVELVETVSEFIRGERNNFSLENIETKGKHNFVTHVDKGAEERLVQGLHKILPDAGFITEEGTNNETKEKFNWVIDPLDGTTNFIHGAPPYSISVALMDNNQVVVGVVLNVPSRECFHSYLGGKVYLNGKAVKTSGVKKVSDSLIATGFPYSNFGRLEPFMKTLDYFFNYSHGVRRLGSAAIDLAWVACGRYDAFYEYNLNPWDVAAGAFLVAQAGGYVADFKGGNNFLFGKEIIATNGNIFGEFQQIVGGIMNK